MAVRERFHTRLEIIRCAYNYILEKGITKTSIGEIAKDLDVSKSNIIYYFSCKDALFADFIRNLCEYQSFVLEQEIKAGHSSLTAYFMEIASMLAVSSTNPVAYDIYTNAYTYPLALQVVREYNTERTKAVFGSFCLEWGEKEFAAAENLISGIEYSSIMKQNTELLTVEERIRFALYAVMKIYNIPESLTRQTIDEVLALDYHKIGQQFLDLFTEYIVEKNEQELKAASRADAE